VVDGVADEAAQPLGELAVLGRVEGAQAFAQQVDKLGAEGEELEEGVLAGPGDVVDVPAVALLYPQHVSGQQEYYRYRKSLNSTTKSNFDHSYIFFL
jgi:hypothetical protein